MPRPSVRVFLFPRRHFKRQAALDIVAAWGYRHVSVTEGERYWKVKNLNAKPGKSRLRAFTGFLTTVTA